MNNPLNFSLTHTISQGKDITLNASWTPGEHTPLFITYLIGVNPLTGESFENEICRFSSGFTSVPSKTLPYHGTYTLQVRMKLQDNPPEVCYETQIKLNNPHARPKLSYKIEKQDGFMHVTIDCNCWKFSHGKVWLVFEGQRQPLILKKRPRGGHYDFYLATTDIPSIEITDPTIVKEERS